MKASDLTKAQELIDEYNDLQSMLLGIAVSISITFDTLARRSISLDTDDKKALDEMIQRRANRIKTKLEALGVEVE